MTEELSGLGQRILSLPANEPLGPMAAVLPKERLQVLDHCFLGLSPSERPARIFTSVIQVQNWLRAVGRRRSVDIRRCNVRGEP